MSAALPDHLDPWRAVKAGLAFDGGLSLAALPRLQAALIAEGGDGLGKVEYRLVFERDQEGRPSIGGVIRSRFSLRCQRCLGDVWLDIDLSPRLILTRTDQAAAALQDDLDCVFVDDDGIRLVDLIEDELLLAIPPYPRHEPGECLTPDVVDDELGAEPDLASEQGGVAEHEEATGRPNPFAVLASLRRVK